MHNGPVSGDNIKLLTISDGMIDAWTTWLNAQDAEPFGAGIVIMCTALVRRNAPNVIISRVDTNSKVSSKASFSPLLLI